ncbi:uncharacterized protein DUF3276 [Schleiferia thermophila]|uniref:Uncharacterized protein DUF3276 n=2 Tax=Schleiferia thermophila TaxID=884107 RepID=A0A369A3Z6_9FLAO|nr:uncharacterized protein DUF3276 [Schleiferia thermophila]
MLKKNIFAAHQHFIVMQEKEHMEKDEIYSKVLRAGSRTYFFDVRATKANDYYLTITESKKLTDGGEVFYKKHKIYLYKEDFNAFKDLLDEITQFIINEKGEEVISERHDPNFNKGSFTSSEGTSQSIDFNDL